MNMSSSRSFKPSTTAAAAIDQSKLYVPLEVIHNILSRLPVRSLLRFKSVCKPWFTTISDPNKFAQDHLLHQSALNPNELLDCERILLVPRYNNYGGYQFPALDLDFTTDDHNNSCNSHSFKVGTRLLTNLPRRRQKDLCGSCNGLLLLRFRRYRFVIWNPSTGACTDFSYQVDDDYVSSSIMISGLCYDSSQDDYKVVFTISRLNTLVVVYSLKSNSWKETGEVFPYYYTYSGANSVIVNGALHWVVGNYSRAIVYFDLLDEKFKELPLSECLQKRYYSMFDQIVLQRGRLCLFSGGRDHTTIGSVNFEVWIMNEYGVGESWAKLFTIPLYGYSGVSQPYQFCFTKKDRLLCVGGNGDAALYCPKQNEWELVISAAKNRPYYVTTYVPSLVSPSFGNKRNGEK